MKKTDFITRLAIALIFAAFVCYFAFSVIHSLTNPFKSVLAVNMTVQEGFKATGMVVRNETVVGSGGFAAVEVTVSEGEKVSAGGVIAGVYGSEAALAKVRQAEALDTKIRNLESVANSGADTANMKVLDENIRENIFKLAIATQKRSLSSVSGISTNLQANIMIKNSGGGNLQAQLSSLRQQRAALGNAVSTNKIIAPASGLFSASLDGFESVTADSIKSITAEGLKALLAEKRSPEQGALGKLVSGARWYYAALIKAEDAGRLVRGEKASMVFGRYLGSVIEMDVESIGNAQDGQCAVIFSSNLNIDSMLSVRMQTVQIICREYSGVRVPKAAMCLNSEGKSSVYTLSGVYAEQKFVKILYEAEDYYIVESTGASSPLRAGDQVITTTKDLYNGKMVK